MVNFGVGPAFVLGVFLAVAGAGLYFLRSMRPELSRDHDIFFAAVGLVCGLILMFYGWRLEPALQFGQFLLAGTTIFFAYEAIRLRGIATEQARRNTPIVDDERPVSKVYREAKLDDLDPYEGRRLTGTREPRSARRSEYELDSRRQPKSRSRSADRYGTEEATRSRRPRPSSPPSDRYSDPYSEENGAESYGETDYSPSRSRRPRPDLNKDEPPARPRQRRPRPSESDNLGVDLDATPVDYQPIESEDDGEGDYNGGYDDRDEATRDNRYSQRDRGSYDPMNYGQPYDDGDEEEEDYDDERYEAKEERGTSDRFDY
jgi:Ycf66 protein N-terminus